MSKQLMSQQPLSQQLMRIPIFHHFSVGNKQHSASNVAQYKTAGPHLLSPDLVGMLGVRDADAIWRHLSFTTFSQMAWTWPPAEMQTYSRDFIARIKSALVSRPVFFTSGLGEAGGMM
jgi:hypothetical protein